MAAGGAYLWAFAYGLWQDHGIGGLGRLVLLLAGAAYFTLVSSWFVLSLGGLLGVWMPRLVEGARSWVSFVFGSILGALVGCAAVLINFVPSALHTAGSGISGLQLELVQSSLLQTALKNVVTMIPFAAVWVGLWAVRTGRHFSHERAA